MSKAKKALKRLQGIEDVSGEMALLVEGLRVGGEISTGEYIVRPGDEHKEDQEPSSNKDKIKLYGAEGGLSWIAKPVTSETTPGLGSRQGSMVKHSLVDLIVNLFGGFREKQAEQRTQKGGLFPNYGSMYGTIDSHSQRDRHSDEETHHPAEPAGEVSDNDDLETPLILRQATAVDKGMTAPASQGSVSSMGRHGSLFQGGGETVGSTGIGGGWELAWTLDEKEGGEDGKKTSDGFKRMYLHQDGVFCCYAFC